MLTVAVIKITKNIFLNYESWQLKELYYITDDFRKTSHMEKKYTDTEEEYINKLMTGGMDRKEAEHFLDIMQTVSPGDFSKGLGCIRREPRWMK
jgi:hypothetical protein